MKRVHLKACGGNAVADLVGGAQAGVLALRGLVAGAERVNSRDADGANQGGAEQQERESEGEFESNGHVQTPAVMVEAARGAREFREFDGLLVLPEGERLCEVREEPTAPARMKSRDVKVR